MKKWTIYFATIMIVGLLSRIEQTGVDVASLEPVEVLYVDIQDGLYILNTDTQQYGEGKTVAQAIDDLKERSSKVIYLETAQHLLISRSAWESVQRFSQHLRPDCSVVIVVGQPDTQEAPAFLKTHKPGFTINDLHPGAEDIPILYCEQGGMRLEKP